MVAGERATRNSRSGELRIRGYIAIAHDRSWHQADIKLRPLFDRYGVEGGHHLLGLSLSAFEYCPDGVWYL